MYESDGEDVGPGGMSYYWIMCSDGIRRKYHQNLFEVVQDVPTPTTKPALASEGVLTWRDFANHGKAPNECACRIPRDMCTYHNT